MSAVSSCWPNTRSWPVRTWVAAMKSWVLWQAHTRSKSTVSSEHVAQRVEVERVELVGRELAAQSRVELFVGRQPGRHERLHRPERRAQRAALQGVEGRDLGHTLPELAQHAPRAVAPTVHEAGGQGHRVHGAGAGAADGRRSPATLLPAGGRARPR